MSHQDADGDVHSPSQRDTYSDSDIHQDANAALSHQDTDTDGDVHSPSQRDTYSDSDIHQDANAALSH